MTTDDHSAEKRGRLDGDRRRNLPPGMRPPLAVMVADLRDSESFGGDQLRRLKSAQDRSEPSTHVMPVTQPLLAESPFQLFLFSPNHRVHKDDVE